MEEPTVRRLLAAVNRYSHEKSKISIVPHRKPYTVDPEGNPGAHFLHDTSRTRPPTGPRPRGCAPLTLAGGYAWIHIHTPEPDFFGSTCQMRSTPHGAYKECPAKYGMCMVCSFVPFRSREHDDNTLRTAHPAVIFASHMCLVCGWVWVLDMNTRQQYMKPFYTGTLDINRSQTVPDPGTIGAVPDSIISTNTIHAHHPACKVLQLHLPCTNPAFMQMECIVKT